MASTALASFLEMCFLGSKREPLEEELFKAVFSCIVSVIRKIKQAPCVIISLRDPLYSRE